MTPCLASCPHDHSSLTSHDLRFHTTAPCLTIIDVMLVQQAISSWLLAVVLSQSIVDIATHYPLTPPCANMAHSQPAEIVPLSYVEPPLACYDMALWHILQCLSLAQELAHRLHVAMS